MNAMLHFQAPLCVVTIIVVIEFLYDVSESAGNFFCDDNSGDTENWTFVLLLQYYDIYQQWDR